MRSGTSSGSSIFGRCIIREELIGSNRNEADQPAKLCEFVKISQQVVILPFLEFLEVWKNKQFVILGVANPFVFHIVHLDKINRPNNSQLVRKGRIWMPVNELNVMLCCQKNHQWWHLSCRDAKGDLNRCMQELYLKK